MGPNPNDQNNNSAGGAPPPDYNANSNRSAPGTQQQMQYPMGPSPMQGPPHHFPQYQSQMQNAGMAVGGAVGMMGVGGASMGDGIVAGSVVGGMVGQRIAQAQNHAYWSGQAMEYRQQLAAGMPPASASSDGTKASWWSREGRAQRRMARWERRAERRDGTTLNK